MLNQIQEIHNILLNNNLKIATAESITAGLLQDALASASGASNVFRGGITAYDIDTKEDMLGIDREYAEKCDCVSEKTVREMAKGAQELFRVDIGVATTGYAESYGSSSPHAFFAIAIKEQIFSGMIELSQISISKRQDRRAAVCEHVINQLHSELFILYPSTEIEYKFAVKPEYLDHIKERAVNNFDIKQCYLGLNDKMASRIRIVDDAEAYATTKLEGNIEVEYPVPLGKARIIYDKFNDGIGTIRKKRYIIEHYYGDGCLNIEVDFFGGRHEGLVIAEIEVPNEYFTLPELPVWIDTENKPEVSSNAKLAMLP